MEDYFNDNNTRIEYTENKPTEVDDVPNDSFINLNILDEHCQIEESDLLFKKEYIPPYGK